MANPTREELLNDIGFKAYLDAKMAGQEAWGTGGLSTKTLLELYGAYLNQGGAPIAPTPVPPAPGPEPDEYTPEQIAEYNAYMAALQANPDAGLPVPKDIADYFANRDKWAEGEFEPTPPWPEPPTPEPVDEYTDEEIREYYTYRNYASRYGDPADWYPLDLDDYFKNWDIAQEQLDEWKGEASTADQERIEYEARQEADRARQEEYDKYALSPEEQARRREESYQYGLESKARSEYAAQEAYHEQPAYEQGFAGWLESQGNVSQYLQDYIENKYPSLRTQYQATQPLLTGFPNRGEARAEAARREAGFEKWLPEQTAGLTEEFYAQAPQRRGERPWAFDPRIKQVSF